MTGDVFGGGLGVRLVGDDLDCHNSYHLERGMAMLVSYVT